MKNSKSSRILTLVIGFFAGALAAALVVFIIMCGVGNMAFVNRDNYESMSEFYKEYKDLAAVDYAIDKYYYKDVKDGSLVENACKGAVISLKDPYSAYMNKEEYESYMTSAEGEYSGIGIVFSTDADGKYIVQSVTAGSPASQTDIAPGDQMLKADGKSYADSDLFASALRGRKGTDVKLTYVHDGRTKEVTLTRAVIKQVSVEHELKKDKTGYIKISQFIGNTGKDFTKALEALEAKGCNKIVLDLRNNGGGIVSEAVSVADHFIDKGVIVSFVDKNGKKEEFKAKSGKTDSSLVVLVNDQSASSAEILAGALQDNDYTIVGEKTFGKGIVQSNVELEDGSSLKLTIAQYLTPDGHKVHKKGIKPDVKVVNDKKDKDHDYQLDKAMELLNK